jgi:hypothetical protein
MFMVGGGIVSHGIPPLHHFSEGIAHLAGGVPGIGGVLQVLVPTIMDALTGIVAGALILLVVIAAKRVFQAVKPKPGAA